MTASSTNIAKSMVSPFLHINNALYLAELVFRFTKGSTATRKLILLIPQAVAHYIRNKVLYLLGRQSAKVTTSIKFSPIRNFLFSL